MLVQTQLPRTFAKIFHIQVVPAVLLFHSVILPKGRAEAGKFIFKKIIYLPKNTSVKTTELLL